MQVLSEPDVAAHFDRILAREVPGMRGLQAWDALLRSHATLLRQLETDLESKTGLALADFDVLAQLAIAGGSLRMTELADRALISRSGMTRRVTRLVHEGLVRRAHADADARGVVVQLTNSGLKRLTVAAPVHIRGVSDLFLTKLDDQALAAGHHRGAAESAGGRAAGNDPLPRRLPGPAGPERGARQADAIVCARPDDRLGAQPALPSPRSNGETGPDQEGRLRR